MTPAEEPPPLTPAPAEPATTTVTEPVVEPSAALGTESVLVQASELADLSADDVALRDLPRPDAAAEPGERADADDPLVALFGPVDHADEPDYFAAPNDPCLVRSS